MKNIIPVLLMLAVAGCNTVNTVESTPTQTTVGTVLQEQRIITDSHLHGYLTVGRIIGNDVGGLQKISTTLTNNRDTALDITYKVEWLDRSGALISSPIGGWKRIHFEGRESLSLSEIAISPAAADFRLKIQQQ